MGMILTSGDVRRSVAESGHQVDSPIRSRMTCERTIIIARTEGTLYHPRVAFISVTSTGRDEVMKIAPARSGLASVALMLVAAAGQSPQRVMAQAGTEPVIYLGCYGGRYGGRLAPCRRLGSTK
jgi:hypothetical protein